MARHIVVIGAARSGTKIVRDSLAVATGAGAVPYDVGYVWRYGNESVPHDVLDPESATDRVRRFIRRFVDRYARDGAVIEKTVGNALRVPFVSQVLPDARYIHLIRDGVDVIESTRRQWTEPSDLGYLTRKARHFPARLIPTYGVKYARSLARRRANGDGRVGSWGPRYPGIDADLRQSGLLVVCARQWRLSVSCATDAFETGNLPVHQVRYEELVSQPRHVLAEIADFAELPATSDQLASAAARISAARRGAGRAALQQAEARTIDEEAGSTLTALGYARARDIATDEAP